MRVAIQISGEFRVLHFCLPKLQKYVVESFPSSEVDFFIHTWWKESTGFGTIPFEGRGDWHQTMFVYDHSTGISLFKPKAYFLEKMEDVECLKGKTRAIAMFYSIWRANEARHEFEKMTGIHYDLVMRYRTDCIINEPLYRCIQDEVEQKKPFLCIPIPTQIQCADGPVDNNEEASICDWFAIGTPEVMDIYCQTFCTFKDYDVPFVPESMLAMQLKAYGIVRATTLRRPSVDFYLVEGTGQIRGAAGKESLKNPDDSEER